MITRALGAEQYGNFNYLKIIFEKMIGFFDVFTSAFYPKLSKRPGDSGILLFVIIYDIFLFFLSFLLLTIIFSTGEFVNFLTVHSFSIASSILLFTWLLIISQKMTFFMDALGKTITNELVLIFMRIAITIGIIIYYLNGNLDLVTFVHIQNTCLIIFLLILSIYAYKFFAKSRNPSSIKKVSTEFKDYSMPLFLASIVGTITALADRWLLQIFGGATEQGYFSLGFNIGAICLLLTGSFTPLLLREYAIAHEQNNRARLVYLFSKYLPLFYVLTSFISCFLCVHGDWAASLIGGSDFNEAVLPVMILGLAPIHQTYGQLSGSLMTATDRTNEYGGIDIFISIIGLPVTYFILAPKSHWGFNLGATGLAIKLLVLQIIAVNIQLWFNTRQLGIGQKKILIHQISVITIFLGIASLGKFIAAFIFQGKIISLLVSGSVYIIFSISFIWVFPNIVAMSKKELLSHISTLLSYLHTKKYYSSSN